MLLYGKSRKKTDELSLAASVFVCFSSKFQCAMIRAELIPNLSWMIQIRAPTFERIRPDCSNNVSITIYSCNSPKIPR